MALLKPLKTEMSTTNGSKHIINISGTLINIKIPANIADTLGHALSNFT